MATSLLRGVRSIRRNSAGMVLGFVVSVLTVWIYLLLVMVVHFWQGHYQEAVCQPCAAASLSDNIRLLLPRLVFVSDIPSPPLK